MLLTLKRWLHPNMQGARTRLTWIILLATTAALLWRGYPAEGWADQGWVLAAKLNRIVLGGVVALTFDQTVFWYARPSVDSVHEHWMYRRAIIVVGGMLAAALAL